ncbi:MAG: D-alanyl-D-alanine dipeptidase [Pseudanabaena sp.]|nr:MAG: D-alanyl-D-alanine dipeptidase [Pseudanabaena sp.]
MLKPYQAIPIEECNQPLTEISGLITIDPHPYMSLGAPYGDRSPFFVRQGILEKLRTAQAYLQEIRPEYQLAVFDAYRPIAVQQFMVDYSLAQLAEGKGLELNQMTETEKTALMSEVLKFWALPSHDPKTPPPHSTGAAIDVTFYDANTHTEVNMGAPIDEISDRSLPDYFASFRNAQAVGFNRDRQLLNQVMSQSGFQRHPNEWWHFSYGDQMWAWLSDRKMAIYGGLESL